MRPLSPKTKEERMLVSKLPKVNWLKALSSNDLTDQAKALAIGADGAAASKNLRELIQLKQSLEKRSGMASQLAQLDAAIDIFKAVLAKHNHQHIKRHLYDVETGTVIDGDIRFLECYKGYLLAELIVSRE